MELTIDELRHKLRKERKTRHRLETDLERLGNLISRQMHHTKQHIMEEMDMNSTLDHASNILHANSFASQTNYGRDRVEMIV